MNEAVVRTRIRELMEMLRAAPAARTAADPAQGVYLPHRPTHELGVAEELDHLRLQLKYVLFDLEATHRENKYLRQMLDSRRNRPHRDDDDMLC